MKKRITQLAVVAGLLVAVFVANPAVAAQAGRVQPGPAVETSMAPAGDVGLFACYIAGPDRDLARPVMQQPAANVRTGPSTSCGLAGQIYQGYRLNYNCYVIGEDPGTGYYGWTYLLYVYQDEWYAGWVNDGLLPNHGSNVLC